VPFAPGGGGTGNPVRLPSGGLLPPGPSPHMRLGRGWASTPALTIRIFSSPDAPLLPFPHVQGNPRAGVRGCNPRAEADFAIRSVVSSHMEGASSRKSSSLLPGGWPPPDPPAHTIGTGTGKPCQPDHQDFFIDRCTAPPVPSCPGAILARGSGGATPGQRRTSTFVLSSLRT